MAVQIEILHRSQSRIGVAFYYPIAPADQLPSAANQTRGPAGSSLSAAEIQDLKDGKLIEVTFSPSIPAGANIIQIKAGLEARYTKNAAPSLARYKRRYRFSGANFNGTDWSI